MLIKIPENWRLPESAVTPEEAFHNRRKFMKTLGVGLAAASLNSSVLTGATGGFPAKINPRFKGSGLETTAFEYVTSYNNFYEFTTDKADVKELANQGWKTEPWTIQVGGLVDNPFKIDVNELIKKVGGLEERIYRLRCVEAWSMVVPWDGFSFLKLIELAQPKETARFVKFTTFLDPQSAPGQRSPSIDWPYVEALTLEEASHPLTLLATGVYGKPLPHQNGAPIRLVVPWKYGFKSIKSIVKIEFTRRRPRNTWQLLAPQEYGFYANVNPEVDHPRWSQATERVIGGGFFARQPTLPFNGYEKDVDQLYKGLNLRLHF